MEGAKWHKEVVQIKKQKNELFCGFVLFVECQAAIEQQKRLQAVLMRDASKMTKQLKLKEELLTSYIKEKQELKRFVMQGVFCRKIVIVYATYTAMTCL